MIDLYVTKKKKIMIDVEKLKSPNLKSLASFFFFFFISFMIYNISSIYDFLIYHANFVLDAKIKCE